MLFWLLGVVVMLVIWARVWQQNPKMAFGVLVGLLLAWLFSRLIAPYLEGEAQVPVWLPPLPFAIVATTLFVFGALVWIRGPQALERERDNREH